VPQPIKKVNEVVPFAKAPDVEAGMLKKHGPEQTYGPGTFGVEIELTPENMGPDDGTLTDAIANADAYTLLRYIERFGDKQSFQWDYDEWLKETRENDNRRSYGNMWNDAHGPIDVDTWLENNPEPDESDFEDAEAYEDAMSKWSDSKSDIEWEYRNWDRNGSNNYKEEYVNELQNREEITRYVHDTQHLYNEISDGDSNDNNSISIRTEITRWLKNDQQRVSNSGQASKTEWGVGEDGDNVEIRTPHLEKKDFNLMERFMNMIAYNGYQTSGNTSAHVHIGLPADFDYFDLLAMITLVDESAIKVDAGPKRNFEQWAALRNAFYEQIIKFLIKKSPVPPGRNIPIIGKSMDLNEDQFQKLINVLSGKFMGTNIGSFFERGTVEFRYLSSQIIEQPKRFLQWVNYFMILPAVAQKRNRVVYKSDGGWTMVAYRKPDNGVQLVFQGGSGQMAGTPAKDLKAPGVEKKRLPSGDSEIVLNDKEKMIRRYLRQMLELVKKKGSVNNLSDKEYDVLSKLEKAWRQIAAKNNIPYHANTEPDTDGL
jgi:hypothetical protein